MSILTVDRGGRYRVDPLHQWDKNQTLEISGLTVPNTPEIHFANKAMTEAFVRQAQKDVNGIITVDIPNVILEKPLPIDVYICAYEGDLFRTLYTLEIPVKARTKPSDYIYEKEDEILSFNALNNRLSNSIATMQTLVNNAVDNVNKECDDNYESLVIKCDENLDELTARCENYLAQLTEAFNERVDALREEVVGEDTITLEAQITNLVTVLGPISIIPGEWSANTCAITSDKITANSVIDIYYASASKSIMSDAEPSYTVSTGKIVITVVNKPTSTVTIDCIKVVNDV